MAREALREARGGKAAIISAPSVMNGIKVGARQSVLSCSAKYFPCGIRKLNIVSFAHVYLAWNRDNMVAPLFFSFSPGDRRKIRKTQQGFELLTTTLHDSVFRLRERQHALRTRAVNPPFTVLHTTETLLQLLKSDGWTCGAGGGATVYIFEYDRRFDQAYPESFV